MLPPLNVSCFSKIQIGFTFLVLAYPGSPGKRPLNGCVCVWPYKYAAKLQIITHIIDGSDFCCNLWGSSNHYCQNVLPKSMHYLLGHTAQMLQMLLCSTIRVRMLGSPTVVQKWLNRLWTSFEADSWDQGTMCYAVATIYTVAPWWLPVMLSVVTVIFVFSAETIKRRYVCYSFFDVGHWADSEHTSRLLKFCWLEMIFVGKIWTFTYRWGPHGATENARHEFAAPDCRAGKCET